MPSRLAVYIAASASRISSSAVRGSPATATETPRLVRSAISRPPSAGRRGEQVEDALGGVGGLLAADVLEQDRELVAAEARGGVDAAHGAVEPPRDRDQHLVADRVPERVVDLLEVVEVEEEHRERAVVAAPAGQRLARGLDEHRAVGEPGDGVVEGLVRELGLERLALADVAGVEQDAADVPPRRSGS